MINVGIIGVGNFGKQHVRVLSEMDNVSLKAFVEPNFLDNPVIQDCLEKDKNASACASIDTLIEDQESNSPRLDAICIFTPVTTHYEILKKIIIKSHIKNIFCEKPLTHSYETAKEIKKLAEKNKVKIMVGYIERFNEIFEELKRDDDALCFYASDSLRSSLNAYFVRLSDHHLVNPNVDVDCLLDIFTHDLDLLMALRTKDIEPIHAVIVKKDGIIDYADVEFKSGDRILCSRLADVKLRYIWFNGKHYDLRKWTIEPLKKELEHFIDCIIRDKEPINNLDNAVENLRIIDLIKERQEGYDEFDNTSIRKQGL